MTGRTNLASLRMAVLVASLSVMVAVIGVTTWSTWQSRVEAVRQTHATSASIRDVVVPSVSQLFDALDLSLQGAQEAMQLLDYRRVQYELEHALLFGKTAQSSPFGALFVLDAQGDVRYDMRSTDAAPVNRADWPSFRQHRDNPALGFYISTPVAQPDGRDVVVVSRRLSRPNGDFGGVVLGTIRLGALLQVLGHQNIEGVSVSLIRTDGLLLARYPLRLGDGGSDLNGHPIMRSFHAAQTGSFDAVAPLDGVHHFTSYAAVPRMPLLVRVAYDGDASLSVWRRQAFASIGVVTALLLTQLALTAGLWHAIGARAEAETAQRRLALQLEGTAQTDEVTGLPNRRRFDQEFDVEWRRMMRNRSCLTLLLIDVDHFALYSQAHGPAAGDVVLAAVARCITGTLRRAGDRAARYSEAKFALLLPDTSREGAETVARAIHETLEVAHLEFPASNHERVTVSIGIATATHGPEPGSISCFEAADAALSEAREAGSNRIVASNARIGLA